MTEQKATVAGAVHYVGPDLTGVRCWAATVTVKETDGDPLHQVGLAVLNPGGLFFAQDVAHNAGSRSATAPLAAGHGVCEHGEVAYPIGTWHWPERA